MSVDINPLINYSYIGHNHTTMGTGTVTLVAVFRLETEKFNC